MRILMEMIQVVKGINLKPSDFLSASHPKKSKLNLFYKKIISGDFESDLDASEFFFKSDTNNSNYKNLKYSLKERLINSLFFLDAKRFKSDQGKALIYCTKYLLAGNLLVRLSAKKAGVDLCLKVLKKSLDFELTEFVMLSSRILRSETGSIKGDIEKFNYYNNLFKTHKTIWEIEVLAEEYYNLLVIPYTKDKSKKIETSQNAKEYYNKLAGYLQEYDSAYLHLNVRLIQIIHYEIMGDFDKVLLLSEEAIQFFSQKKFIYNTPIRIFSHKQLIAFIQLKDYKKGKIAANKAAENTRIGTYSWYINQELHLMLALHAKEYQESYLILTSVINHSRFKNVRPRIKERWLLNKAYIQYLIFISKVTVEEGDKKQIRMGRFLNSVPIYSKDKQGLNIPILIIQILFMITKKDYEQSIDRFDAIKKYCSRYLSKDSNPRSNYFINMLLQIPLANFHRSAVLRKAQKYYDKLISTPLEVANQIHEVEIIPYEDLWEFVINSLDMKIHQIQRYM